MRWRATFTIQRRGVEWRWTVREIDRTNKDAAIRHGRRLILKLWPGSRVRVRGCVEQHAGRGNR